MSATLRLSVGQHSDRGRKPVNQDFYGVASPQEPLRTSKGVAIALADGIGSSDVSQVASEFAVMGLLDDYYCTSEAWSVKRSVERVLTAVNSWLHARTQQSPYRDARDRGYVCTLSALVIKGHTAHVFHVGDSRIYRLHAGTMEQLTQDHRVWVSREQSYLSRAVGFNRQIEIDYQALRVEVGDRFLLLTDGVYEHVDDARLAELARTASANDLDAAAKGLVELAHRNGSDDNLTVQLVVVDELADDGGSTMVEQWSRLPAPPPLDARMELDGYTIVRKLHGSHRSHLYLAVDRESGATVALKTPATDLQADPAALERFLMEEWIARRIESPHVLKPCAPSRPRQHLYLAMEYIEGQTLAQWKVDHPRPALDEVRSIIEQVARGLQAFHRLEMLHQDLRPENVMIDRTGTVKIIDFGATSVAGIAELGTPLERSEILGTAAYTAPEYFLGQAGTWRSDLYSLAVITYQLLSDRLPYGTEVAKCRTVAAQRRLQYDPVLSDDRDIPAWIDAVLRKALQPTPHKRHESLSEFVHDLRHPSADFLRRARPALVERNPLLFWKGLSVTLAILLLAMLMLHFGMR